MANKIFDVLYLHIGLEKTGTTSIQHVLDRNRDRLATAGVFLPRSLGQENHKTLAAYGFDAGSRDIAVTSQGIGAAEAEVQTFRSQVETALEKEIAASTATRAIISSEDLSRLFRPHEVARVLQLLQRFCKQLRVIVFLRRQDLLASSRHYSLVLGGGRPGQVFPAADAPGQRYYDYNALLTPWIDQLGADHIDLLRFPETPAAEAFDSPRAFARLTGIDLSDFDLGRRQHSSYDAVNQLIIHNFNALQQGYDPQATEALMQQLQAHNQPGMAHIPSAAQAREFYQRFSAGNAALLARLGAEAQGFSEEAQGFSEDFSMYPDHNMRQAYMAQAIQRLLQIRASAGSAGQNPVRTRSDTDRSENAV